MAAWLWRHGLFKWDCEKQTICNNEADEEGWLCLLIICVFAFLEWNPPLSLSAPCPITRQQQHTHWFTCLTTLCVLISVCLSVCVCIPCMPNEERKKMTILEKAVYGEGRRTLPPSTPQLGISDLGQGEQAFPSLPPQGGGLVIHSAHSLSIHYSVPPLSSLSSHPIPSISIQI